MNSFLKSQIKKFAPVLLTMVIVLIPVFAHAQYDNTSGSQYDNTAGSKYDNTAGNNDPFQLKNPLGVDSICKLIGLLLQAAVAIGIPIAVLFIVYAGFKFVMARGSPGALTEARSNLVATLIGIAIFVGASLIANVIIATLAQLGANGVTNCTF
ncbi:MAG: pilin [Patescibacteria group bacterium]